MDLFTHISLETAYGSVSLFTSILHNVFLLYHVDMFVSVYKIDKFSFWVGEVIFLMWNSFNDPLFGWFSDKRFLNSSAKKKHSDDIVWTRLGALHLCGPLFAIAFTSFWINWAWPGIQFAVCLCLYDGFLTMIDLHHSALMADLSVSANERTKLNSRCSIFSTFGSASVFLSYLVWNKSELTAFRLFCCGLAFFSFFGYMIMIGVLKTAYAKQHRSPTVKNMSKDMMHDEEEEVTKDWESVVKFSKQLLSHKNFLWFAGMNLIQVFHCHFNSNFFPLFLDTLLKDALSPTLASFLLGASFVAPHINNLYFLSLCRRYGVYAVIRGLFVVKLLLSVFIYLVGSNHIWLLCFFIASNRVFTEGTCKLLSLVISDLVDEDAVLHSRHQAVSALVFGTAALASKPGQTLAPLIGTWILAVQTGHDIFQTGSEGGSMKIDLNSMDIENQTVYRDGVFHLLVSIPIVCAFLQLLAWSQFTLHGERLARVKQLRYSLHHLQV